VCVFERERERERERELEFIPEMCYWTLNVKQTVLRLVQVPQASQSKKENAARVQARGTSAPENTTEQVCLDEKVCRAK